MAHILTPRCICFNDTFCVPVNRCRCKEQYRELVLHLQAGLDSPELNACPAICGLRLSGRNSVTPASRISHGNVLGKETAIAQVPKFEVIHHWTRTSCLARAREQ